MFAKKLSPLGISTNVLAVTEGNKLCSDTDIRKHYVTAAIDVSSSDAVSVNVTDGATTSTVALDGGPIDWSDADNDDALIRAIIKVAEDLGYISGGGCVGLTRSGNDLTIRVPDTTLVFNWIGTASTDENDFTASDVG